MHRASSFFTEQQQQAIEQAVADAESKTSAEIVPVLATASGRYDRAEDLIGLWTGAVFLAVTWFLFRNAQMEADWGIAWGRYELPALLAALVLGFVVGVVAGTRIAWLRRLFTPQAQMREEVDLSAREAFVDWRVHRTGADTGVLVYISLFERMTAVLADGAALDALGQEGLQGLCADLTAVLQSPAPGAGLCQFLGKLGDELAPKLPRSDDDKNELPDNLVIID